MVVASAVGAVGLVPTYRALEAGKDVALANKETLVMAGRADARARPASTGARLLPIDSEHCALHQCLRRAPARGRAAAAAHRLGRPVPQPAARELRRASRREEALAHPTWRMGPQDHDRLGDAHEQGPRGDRGALAVRRRRPRRSTC